MQQELLRAGVLTGRGSRDDHPVAAARAEEQFRGIAERGPEAGNLLLANIGGPAGLTAFARGLGDNATRLDRTEPTLNEALPGDPRDTTSPNAMATTLSKLVLGTALSPASRAQLATWMVATKTGNDRLRAGLPKSWRVGDKTGTGERGTANDIAVIWPTGRAPMVMTVYLTGASGTAATKNAVIADVARAVVTTLG